ncbi:TPA: hypothetical protein JRX33_004034 [Elizabethkingia anophelis]|nr:hypothetical protein [Elizabethkingia anophelis]HAY3509525.1 hypothetical protein [Elizabethkingia anophelis]
MAKEVRIKKIFNKRKINKNEKQRIRLRGRAIIPSVIKIHIDECIIINPPDFKYKTEWFYHFVATIISKQNSFNNKELDNIPIILNSVIMRGQVYNYNKYMEWLIQQEILLKINYSAGNYSTGYYFADFIYSLLEKDQSIEVVDMKNLDSDKLYLEQSIRDCEIYHENKHLLKWFNDKLRIDYKGVLDHIENANIDSYRELPISSIMSKKMHWMNQVSRIHYKVFTATRNEESDYRLHTVFTNLKKVFKSYITYDEKRLVGFDLKNSQPYFLLSILDYILYTKHSNSYIDFMFHKIYSKNYYMTFILQEFKETASGREFQKEYNLLKQWILNGTMYENLAEILEPKSHLGGFYNQEYIKNLGYIVNKRYSSARNLMKAVFIKALFCKSNTKDQNYKKLREKLPHFIGMLEILKEKNHKDLSRLLQNIESHCIIDFVTKKIAGQYPEMPLFTIHDSISTTEDYANVLEELMIAYVSEFTGLPPKIARENWFTENQKNKWEIEYGRLLQINPLLASLDDL